MNVLCAKNLPISKKLSPSLDSYVEIYHISQSSSSTTAASVSTAASAISSITTMQQSSTSSKTSHINSHSLSKHNHPTSNTQHYNHPLHAPSQSSFRALSHSDIRNIGLPHSALQSSQCYSESEIISILSELSSKFGEY